MTLSKLNTLLNYFEKQAKVIDFKPRKTTFDDPDEFEKHVRNSDIEQRKSDLVDAILQTAALESESVFLDLDEQAFIDLKNYLNNWITSWT